MCEYLDEGLTQKLKNILGQKLWISGMYFMIAASIPNICLLWDHEDLLAYILNEENIHYGTSK